MKNWLYILFLVPIMAFSQYKFEFGYTSLNNVDLKEVQPFMSKKMKMSLTDTGAGDKVSINQDPKKITIKYNVFNHNGDFVIKDCTIIGDAERGVDFYVQFWNTDLKFDEAKEKETVVNHYGNDRIALTFIGDAQAKISITSDKYKSVQEYKDFSND